MATYYQYPKRPQRDNILDNVPSDLGTYPSSPPPLEQSILIFPSPPSDPSSPSSQHLRRKSTTPSIPASLISSVEARSPTSGGTPTDSWDELSSDAQRLRAPEPLTHDRLAQLQSGLEWSDDDQVEHWEWSGGMSSSSNPSSLLHGRRPLSQRALPSVIGTDYHSASSEFHFSTLSSSRGHSEDESDFGSLFMVELRKRDDPNILHDLFASTNSSTIHHSETFQLPFESWLRYIFNLDPTTLDLLKKSPRPHLSNLYHDVDHSHLGHPRALLDVPTVDEKVMDGDRNLYRSHEVFFDGPYIAFCSLRKGFEVLSDQSTSLHGIFSSAIRVPHIILQAMLRK